MNKILHVHPSGQTSPCAGKPISLRSFCKTVVLAGCGCLTIAAGGLRADEVPVRLSVETDRPDAIYSVGQPAKFLITAKRGDGPAADLEAACTLDWDGRPAFLSKTVKMGAEGTATVEGTLDGAGFLHCRLTLKDGGKAITAHAAAGFDPQKISPSLPVPEDFDAFWVAQKARLAAVPMNPVLTPVKSSKEIECFDAEIACVPPRPVAGYFARPAGAAPRSLPAVLMVQRAGVLRNSPDAPIGVATKFHALVLDINAHGLPNNNPELFKEIADKLGNYVEIGREDREQSYFLGMYLRLARALEFLTAQPEWDGRTLIVRGGSQGGGQAIVAAGLDPRVSFIAANVPAMCDHTGGAVGRVNGWPGLVPKREDGTPDPKVQEAARYFDAMNFATRARAAAIFNVGFLDPHCPPTSVYAAYNNYAGDKRIVNKPRGGHDFSPGFGDEAIAAHIAARKPQAEK